MCGSLIGDLAFIKNRDLIGPLQQARTVRHDERAAACIFIQPVIQRIQEISFGARVEPFCGFVEQEHRSVLDEGARQGDPARLSS